MFIHNFKYSLKILLKSKILLFWTFAFPIILGTFFNMAFSNIENSEKLDIIDIAIINNYDFENNEVFKQTFQTLSDETNEDRIFNTKYVSLEKAKELLKNSEIIGYVLVNEEDVNITVNSSGIDETILRYVVDEIQTNKEIIQNLVQNEMEEEYKMGNFFVNYEEVYKNVVNLIENSDTKLNNISNENLSYTMIEYYTLIAMACLYGGTLSMFITNFKLANMKEQRKKNCSISYKKRKNATWKFT